MEGIKQKNSTLARLDLNTSKSTIAKYICISKYQLKSRTSSG